MAINTHIIEKVNLNSIKRLSFNRDTNLKQVNAITNSITYHGLLRLPVCVRTKSISGKKEIFTIDGQHLIAALDKVNCRHTNAIIVETESVEEIVQMMAVLNNVSLKWNLNDYVNAYTALGIYDYNVLKKHCIDNELSIAISAEILSGNNECKTIKKGTFKLNSGDSDIITKHVVDFKKIVSKNISKLDKAYIRFVRSLGKDYNHKAFLDYLIKEKSLKSHIPQDTTFLYTLLHELYKKSLIH
jgi:hypothetical protein